LETEIKIRIKIRNGRSICIRIWTKTHPPFIVKNKTTHFQNIPAIMCRTRLALVLAGLGLASAQDITVTCSGVQYFFHAIPMSWDNAEQYCMGNYDYANGHLAAIRSADQNTCIATTLVPQGGNGQVWTGLTDDKPFSPTKMDFRWVDTPALAPTYFNWNTG
jgi:hypothetical protein